MIYQKLRKISKQIKGYGENHINWNQLVKDYQKAFSKDEDFFEEFWELYKLDREDPKYLSDVWGMEVFEDEMFRKDLMNLVKRLVRTKDEELIYWMEQFERAYGDIKHVDPWD